MDHPFLNFERKVGCTICLPFSPVVTATPIQDPKAPTESCCQHSVDAPNGTAWAQPRLFSGRGCVPHSPRQMCGFRILFLQTMEAFISSCVQKTPEKSEGKHPTGIYNLEAQTFM